MKFGKTKVPGISSENYEAFAANLRELRKKRALKRNRKLITFFSVVAIIIVFILALAVGLPAALNAHKLHCGFEEHTHTDECYGNKKELICGFAECEAHTHTDECYKTEKTLICSISDKEVHIHSDICYEIKSRLICGMQEDEDHTHTDECYEKEKVLICEAEEGKIHKHNDGCYNTEKILVCELEETEGHTHGKSCYVTAENVLICNLEEHTHTKQCYSDPEADAESKSDWDSVFSSLELSGNRQSDLVHVALTQIGYKESKKNYLIGSDGSENGYTRYGAWYGSPYAEWNPLFAAFCLHFAGIDDYPCDGNCANWVSTLKDSEYDLFRKPEDYIPRTGDLVFFDTDGDTLVNRVGIVTKAKVNKDGELKKLYTVEGDRYGKVDKAVYKNAEEYICGYAEMTDDSLDPSVRRYEKELTARGSDYSVTLAYNDSALIPDGAVLKVTEIAAGTPEYQSYTEKSMTAVGTKSEFSFARFFEISVTAGNETYTPESAVLITVQFDKPVEASAEWAASAVCLSETKAETSDVKVGRLGSTDLINSFTFPDAGYAVFGTVLGVSADAGYTESSGTFYKMCSDLSEINKDGTYIIVASDGYYALDAGESAGSTAAAPVSLVPVEGNNGYYTVAGSLTEDMLWKFASADTIYKIKNVGKDSVYLVINGSGKVLSSDKNGNTLGLHFDSGRKCWVIGDSYGDEAENAAEFIAFNGKSFCAVSTESHACDLLILKQTGETLRIPDIDDSKSQTVKPEYPPYVPDSLSKSGEAAIVGGSTGVFYSDKATSGIENLFTGDSSQDGEVLADKSVIFGDDDYGAFPVYEDNTFGVTLSALGQSYAVRTEKTLESPSDVVFVIDASSDADTPVGDGSAQTKREAAVAAVNSAIENILSLHTGNRVGVVLYAKESAMILPVGRYSVTSVIYNSMQPQPYLVVENGKILTNASLKDAVGNGVDRRDNIEQGGGSYLQSGIAEATRIFENMPDVTYVSKTGSGDYSRFSTVYRKPVTVILSCGDSNYCTPQYNDVLGSVVYGCEKGADGSDYNKGIVGFYTVLSACGHKAAVSAHYKGYAPVYTVGIGVGSTGSGDMSGISGSGDDFKRAVLDPDSVRVKALTDKTSVGYANAGSQLYRLLTGSYDGQFIGKKGAGAFEHSVIPVTDITDTVYFGNVSYADGSYFGAFSEEELKDEMQSIVAEIKKTDINGFVLADRGCVEITDIIGVGMELKGAPVLNYGGRCYNSTSSSEKDGVVTFAYNYEYFSADGSGIKAGLNEIKVSVKTDPQTGMQTVRLIVPDNVLPVYSRNTKANFYYEALPVRLIYKVGLTTESVSRIQKLTDGSLEFYVGEWEDGCCTATFIPASDNAFYADGAFTGTEMPKEQNRSETAKECVIGEVEPVQSNLVRVTHKLGNNGKLIFNGKNATFNITVTNEWDDTIGKNDRYELQIGLYSKSGSQKYAVPVMKGNSEVPMTVVLNGENRWTSTFRDIKYPTDNTEYYLVELNSGSYNLKFSDEDESVGTPLYISEDVKYYAARVMPDKSEKVITVSNGLYDEIPTTGGPGIFTYTFAGACIMLAPLMYGCFKKSRQKRRARR